MMKIVPILLLCALFPYVSTQAQSKGFKTVDEYISNFKDIAIREMERSGVPASITLAQGIHESGFGNSQLAKEANNHFGIKCGNDWKGENFQKVADDISISCFRKYTDAETSYIDHSDLLLTRKHYKFLFDLERTDYKGWSHGLRKAGYASDPKYPEKLITAIEKYKLAQYDTMATAYIVFDDAVVFDDSDESVLNATISTNRQLRKKLSSFLFLSYRKGFFRQNNSTYIVAKPGESALAAADRFGIPYQKFLKFNDMIDGDKLLQYQYIYIQPKKSTYKGDVKLHKVQNDETMYEIAQYYGIRLDALLQRNKMQQGQEPANGEVILLAEKALSAPKMRAKNHVDALPTLEDYDSSVDYGIDSTQFNRTEASQSIIINPDTTVILRPTSPVTKEQIQFDNANNTVRPEDSLHFKMPENKAEKPVNSSTTTNKPTTTINEVALFPSQNKIPTTTQQTSNNTSASNSSTKVPLPGLPMSNTQQTNNKPLANSTTNTTANTTKNNTTSNNSSTKPSTTKTGKYKVIAGDSLSKIAKLYKITIAELKALNKMKTDNIYVGQTLIVPL